MYITMDKIKAYLLSAITLVGICPQSSQHDLSLAYHMESHSFVNSKARDDSNVRPSYVVNRYHTQDIGIIRG